MIIQMRLTPPPIFIGGSKTCATVMISVDKRSRRPSRRIKQSVKVLTEICNLINVDDMQFCIRRTTMIPHDRLINMSPKLRTSKFLQKDKINRKISATFSAITDLEGVMSIFRCVICLFRRSRRIKSSAME